jgi:hypothetical protein
MEFQRRPQSTSSNRNRPQRHVNPHRHRGERHASTPPAFGAQGFVLPKTFGISSRCPTGTSPVRVSTKMGYQKGLPEGYRPTSKERSMDKEEWKNHSSEMRAANRAARADQPLEPVNPQKSTHGHGHSSHGYQTTAMQQGQRIRTGITPAGSAGKPVGKASHFHSPKAEAEALGRARKVLDQDIQTGAVSPYDVNGEPTRHRIYVETHRKDGFGYQVIKQKNSSGKVLKDSADLPLTMTDPVPLYRAIVIFEYVASKNNWEPLTYFPVK